MLIANNPDIDVARLLAVVRQDLARSRQPAAMHPSWSPSPSLTGTQNKEKMGILTELISTIQQRSMPRAEIPSRFRERFPFFRPGLVQRIITRIHRALFHDQHLANQAISDALRLVAAELADLRASQEAHSHALRNEMQMAMNIRFDKLLEHLDELKKHQVIG